MYHVSLAFNIYMDAMMNEGKEWRLLGLLYPDDLVLRGESEEDLREMVERFVEVCRVRGLKVNAGKSKVRALNGEEGLGCEIYVDSFRRCLGI